MSYLPDMTTFEMEFDETYQSADPALDIWEVVRRNYAIPNMRTHVIFRYLNGYRSMVLGRQLIMQNGTYVRHLWSANEFGMEHTVNIINDMLQSFIESNEEFNMQSLQVLIVNGNSPLHSGGGGGGQSCRGETVPDFGQMHGVLYIPRNAQNLCGFIALLYHTQKYLVDVDEDDDDEEIDSRYGLLINAVRKVSKAKQSRMWIRAAKKKVVDGAKELQKMLTDEGQELQKFDINVHGKKFVEMFPEFRIVIMTKSFKVVTDIMGVEHMARFTGDTEGMEKFTVILLYDLDHFDYVINLNSYYRAVFEKVARWRCCVVCFEGYYLDRKGNLFHTCPGIMRCSSCLMTFKEKLDYDSHVNVAENEHCIKCDKMYRGQECFDFHVKECQGKLLLVQCPRCLYRHYPTQEHVCPREGKFHCRGCGKRIPCIDMVSHKKTCFPKIQPEKFPTDVYGLDRIYAFDIECYVRDEDQVHVPNLIMIRRLDDDEVLEFDTAEEFIHWLETSIDESVIIYAHNFGGYDGRVLFKYFYESSQILKFRNALAAGTKFMQIEFEHADKTYKDSRGEDVAVVIKFQDSFRHMSQSLRSLPKTYGLDMEVVAKGFYPHVFNKPENRFYKGPLPDKSLFHPNEMKCDEKKEFEKWYTQQEQLQEQYRLETGCDEFYDHDLEFRKYCRSDVNVLAEALKVYMNEYMEQCNGLNPLQSVTIASHCMKHYRINHYPKQYPIAQLMESEFLFAKSAFYGGRTHPCSLLLENAKIGYVDVNSLYPAVMVNCDLPFGKVTWRDNAQAMTEEEILETHGIFQVDIEPTKYLHHPIFCRRNPDTMTNNYPLESITGLVTTSIELHEAIRNGYKVTRVYKVLETKVCRELFKSYIYEAQTAKLLASGVPPEFATEEGKEKFIQEYMDEMGVDLTGKKFEKNPGKRATAKLTNNSLWGKFGENTTRPCVETFYIKTEGDVCKEEMERYHVVMNDVFMGRKTLCQNFNYATEDEMRTILFTKEVNNGYNESYSERTNVMLCAFVTANARMTLWKAMNQLGDRVLYCDTDSIVYVLSDNDEENIKSSSKLGEWKDETEGDVITDFVSIASKSYAYKTQSGKEVVKCKGVTLNYENGRNITFDTMKKLVRGELESLKTRVLNFKCDPKKYYEITTGYLEKMTRLNKQCLNGVLMDRETARAYKLNLPREYMIFPHGFEKFLQELQQKYR